MYAPTRTKSSFFLEHWASVWLDDNVWESRIYELAGFDPIRYRDICDSCTIVEVARAWKTKMALSDFAWSDKDALMKSINWV